MFRWGFMTMTMGGQGDVSHVQGDRLKVFIEPLHTGIPPPFVFSRQSLSCSIVNCIKDK